MEYLTTYALLLALQVQTTQLQSQYSAPQVTEQSLNEEQLVRLMFWDDPHMVDVIQCESSFRQRDNYGKILTSKTHDQGIAQINQVHFKEARTLGFNLSTTEGNLGYARYLYEREGSKPWSCDKIVTARNQRMETLAYRASP